MCVIYTYEPTSLWFFLYFLVFFRSNLLSITFSPVGRALSLSLGSYPDFLPALFPFGVFFGQVFSGLSLTAFVSVVRGSSVLLVFSFFPVSYLIYSFGFHSCAPVPLLNIFTIDVYEINHLIFNIFSFDVCLGQLSRTAF